MNQASFSKRLIAWIIDMVILWIVILILAGIGSTTGGVSAPMAGILAGVLSLLWITLLPFGYFGYFWSNRGRSIGMGIMNIRVVGADDRSLPFVTAGLRGSVGYYISSLLFCLGYFWALIDANQRTWHDIIFKTRVIEE